MIQIKPPSKVYALKLISLRTKKKLSQEDLAAMVGVDRNCVGNIERLERCPSLDKAGKIADALGVTLSSMLATVHTQAERAVDLLNSWLFEDGRDGPASDSILDDNGFDFITETLGPACGMPDKHALWIIVHTFKDGTRCALVLKDTAREVWSVLY